MMGGIGLIKFLVFLKRLDNKVSEAMSFGAWKWCLPARGQLVALEKEQILGGHPPWVHPWTWDGLKLIVKIMNKQKNIIITKLYKHL